MNEFHYAESLINELKNLPNSYGLWAPGDSTRYHVILLEHLLLAPCGPAREGKDGYATYVPGIEPYVGLLVQVGAGGGKSVLVPKPLHRNYDAELWLEAFGRDWLGWWAGVRPLLAALGWSTDESLAYNSGDSIEIAQVYRQNEWPGVHVPADHPQDEGEPENVADNEVTTKI